MAKKIQPKSRALAISLEFSNIGLLVLMAALLVIAYFILRPSHASIAVKPQIGGVIDRHGAPSSTYRNVVNGWVVQANWSDLQPNQGGAIASNNVIDQAIAQARQLNQSNPRLNMRLKLRVYAGISAPNWAKNIGGAPFYISNNQGQQANGGTVGRFWLPAYGSAYQDFQNKLAAKYDGAPEIREVVIDRCSTVFAEPFIREINVAQNVTNYRNAGYTLAADEQCEREEITAHQVWQQTRSSLDLTPYQYITPSGTGTDVNFSMQMADYCRSVLGSRCVVGDNSLRSTAQSSQYDQIYAKIKSMGPPIYFQTATMDKIGDWQAALQKGINEGAGMVELPSGYDSSFPLNTLAGYDNQLEARAQPGTSSTVAPPLPPAAPPPTPSPSPSPSPNPGPSPAPSTVPPPSTSPQSSPTSSGQPKVTTGEVTITPPSVDPSKVSHTDYLVDGELVQSDQGLANLNLDTNQLQDGDHTVEAVVYDKDGKVISSNQKTIKVKNHLSWWQKVVNFITAPFRWVANFFKHTLLTR